MDSSNVVRIAAPTGSKFYHSQSKWFRFASNSSGVMAMRGSLRLLAICGFTFFVNVTCGWAHHSAAATYDTSKPVTLKGVVTKLDWKNPHVYYYIDVTDPAGNVMNWAIES